MTSIGDATTAKIIGRLIDVGYRVSVPFGDGYPYDLVIEKNGIIEKAQCKTASVKRRGESPTFNTTSHQGGNTRVRYKAEEV